MFGGTIERVARVEIDEMASVTVPQLQMFPNPRFPRQPTLPSPPTPTLTPRFLRWCLPPGTGEIIGQPLVQVKRVSADRPPQMHPIAITAHDLRTESARCSRLLGIGQCHALKFCNTLYFDERNQYRFLIALLDA